MDYTCTSLPTLPFIQSGELTPLATSRPTHALAFPFLLAALLKWITHALPFLPCRLFSLESWLHLPLLVLPMHFPFPFFLPLCLNGLHMHSFSYLAVYSVWRVDSTCHFSSYPCTFLAISSFPFTELGLSVHLILIYSGFFSTSNPPRPTRAPFSCHFRFSPVLPVHH